MRPRHKEQQCRGVPGMGLRTAVGSSGLWFQARSLTHQLLEDRKDPLGTQWCPVTMTCIGIPIMTLLVFHTGCPCRMGWGQGLEAPSGHAPSPSYPRRTSAWLMGTCVAGTSCWHV